MNNKILKRYPLPNNKVTTSIDENYLTCSIPTVEEGVVKKVAIISNESAEQLLKDIDECVKKYTDVKFCLRIEFENTLMVNQQISSGKMTINEARNLNGLNILDDKEADLHITGLK